MVRVQVGRLSSRSLITSFAPSQLSLDSFMGVDIEPVYETSGKSRILLQFVIDDISS